MVATLCVPAAPVAGATNSPRTNATVASQAIPLAAPVIGLTATPSGHGYWRAARDGGVLTAGDAPFFGSATRYVHTSVVGIASTPTGGGYWLVDTAGDVFTFGHAPFRGSMGGKHLNQPIVGIAATENGQGYWLVASDGGIFTFSAPFPGSTGGKHLKQRIVGMAATPDCRGCRLVASHGGILYIGAPFQGSMGGRHLNQPIVGMAAAPNNNGYALVASDGGLFNFGKGVPFFGSAAGACPGAPAVGVAMSPGALGYWITFADARTYAFSPTTTPPKCAPADTKLGRMAADLFERTNQERAARGLPALQWDPGLAVHASMWSANMAAYGFRHSDLGPLPGSYDMVGENIAAGSPGVTTGGLHNAWMHSDGHRANILAPGYRTFGAGAYCTADGTIYLTENFGRPTSAGPPPPPTPTPPVYPIARPDPGTLHC